MALFLCCGTALVLLLIFSAAALAPFNFNRADALSIKAIFSGAQAAFGLLASVTSLPEQVKGFAEETGITSTDGEPETGTKTDAESETTSTSPPASAPETETTSPTTSEQETANKLKEAEQRIQDLEAQVESLSPQDQDVAKQAVIQAFDQQFANAPPEQEELAREIVAKQWNTFNEIWKAHTGGSGAMQKTCANNIRVEGPSLGCPSTSEGDSRASTGSQFNPPFGTSPGQNMPNPLAPPMSTAEPPFGLQ